MGLFKDNKDIQEEKDDATKPIQTEEVAEDTEVAPETENETVAPEDTEDREDFNCSNCGGTGLIWHEGAKRHEVCPACFGKGKIN